MRIYRNPRLWLGVGLCVAGTALIVAFLVTPTYLHAMFGPR